MTQIKANKKRTIAYHGNADTRILSCPSCNSHSVVCLITNTQKNYLACLSCAHRGPIAATQAESIVMWNDEKIVTSPKKKLSTKTNVRKLPFGDLLTLYANIKIIKANLIPNKIAKEISVNDVMEEIGHRICLYAMENKELKKKLKKKSQKKKGKKI